jgi:hypothetical protein
MTTSIYFWSRLAQFFLEWEMFQMKCWRENQNTHFMFNNFEYLAVYEIMWQNIVQPGRLQIKIWCMRIAFWIPNATNTHSECVILIPFPLQQWLHASACISTCMYFAYLVYSAHRIHLCCVLLFWIVLKKKQWLFPCTALREPFLKRRRNVFTTRYKLNF